MFSVNYEDYRKDLVSYSKLMMGFDELLINDLESSEYIFDISVTVSGKTCSIIGLVKENHDDEYGVYEVIKSIRLKYSNRINNSEYVLEALNEVVEILRKRYVC